MMLQLLRLPGTVVHETAHGIVVVLLPGVSIAEIDITSHVSYSGAITVPRAVLVSYVPLLLNSVGSAALFGLAVRLHHGEVSTGVHAIGDGAIAFGFLFLALSLGIEALPSYDDVMAPIRIFRQAFPSLRAIIDLLFLVPYLLILPVVLPIVYLREKSLVLLLLSGSVYTVLVWTAVMPFV